MLCLRQFFSSVDGVTVSKHNIPKTQQKRAKTRLTPEQAAHPTKPLRKEVPCTLTENMAQSLNIQRAVEDRILDPRPIECAMEDPAIGVPADDAILLRIVGGDRFGSLARVVGDVDGRVVACFDGGLLGHTLGSVAACHRNGRFGFVRCFGICGLC